MDKRDNSDKTNETGRASREQHPMTPKRAFATITKTLDKLANDGERSRVLEAVRAHMALAGSSEEDAQ